MEELPPPTLIPTFATCTILLLHLNAGGGLLSENCS